MAKNIFSKVLDFIGVEDRGDLEPLPEAPEYAAPREREYQRGEAAREPRERENREPPQYKREYQQPVRQTPHEPIKEREMPQYENTAGFTRSKRSSKVLNYPTGDVYNRHTKITRLTCYEDVRDIIDLLRSDISVLLNLEELSFEDAQRVLDTLTGAAYALDTEINKAAQQTYYLASSQEEVENDYARSEYAPRTAGAARRREY